MFRRRNAQPKSVPTEAPARDSVIAGWDPAAPDETPVATVSAAPDISSELDDAEQALIADLIEPEDLAEPAASTTQAAEVLIDERLVKNAQRGELASFNTLVTRHERAVFNVCLRLLRDAASAEDAAQDTFVKAWTSLDQFRGGMFRPWLLRIASNRCYEIL